MSDTWIAGETARISLSVADTTGAAVDPSVLRLKVRDPGGTVTTYTYGSDAEVVRAALGDYYADLPLDVAGRWAWRWEAETPSGVAESSQQVTASAVVG
jgi:hypothetical protein